MARIRSALPWGIILLFAVSFLIVWWFEDCLIYYVQWRDFRSVQLAERVAVLLRPDLAIALIGHGIWLGGHFIWVGIAFLCDLTASGFNAIPARLRATKTLRFIAWVATSMAATFGGDAIVNFGSGLKWAVGKLVMVLVALNGACWIYNIVRRAFHYAAFAIQMPVRFYSEREVEPEGVPAPTWESFNSDGAAKSTHARRREYTQFFANHVERIGIILPGGGKRGAYQAGALKAIYEFLRDYNSLDKVRMIVGTSTGAWNAMFWLAGMMASEDEAAPAIERWWKSISFGGLMDFPWLYIPFWSSSILRAAPWRERFFEIFRKRSDHLFEDYPQVHFYFSRYDVQQGVTQYSTNWAGVHARIEELGCDKDEKYRFFDVIEAGKEALKRTASALFASIGMPPLFPFQMIDGGLFEDGGAVEGIPFRFASPLEDCDLLFVLPVNGSPAPSGDCHSMTKRLLRVMDLRQGALERAALKHTDTINRIAERIDRIDFGVSTLAPSVPAEGLAADALSGLREEIAEFNQEYKQLYVFTVCPAGELDINTLGPWKQREASDAFDLMYIQTGRELQLRFFEDIEPEDTHVVMVNGTVPVGDELPKPTYRRPAQL